MKQLFGLNPKRKNFEKGSFNTCPRKIKIFKDYNKFLQAGFEPAT